MKIVNVPLLAILLCLSGCLEKSVSDRDKALSAYAAGDYDRARIHLQNALRSAPADTELHFLNARLALDSGNFDLAKTEFQALLHDPKHGKDAQTQLAQAYLASGNPRLALETLDKEPFTTGAAYAIAADANLALNRGAEALALAARGLAAYPQSPPLILLDTQFAIAAGDLPKARSNIEQALALAPDDVPVLLQAARLNLLDGDKIRAEKLFDQALRRKPGNAPALLAKAALAHERGDRETSRRLLELAARSKDPSNLLTRAFMAQMAVEAGDYERANAIMSEVPAALPMPYFDLLRGLIAAGRGQNEQAISQLRNFFQRGGDSPAARVAYASALQKAGQTQQAWQILRPLASAANANAPVLQLAVDLTTRLSLPEASHFRNRLAAVRRPDPIAANLGEANAAIQKGDWATADRIYQQAIAANPDSTNIILFNNAALARLKAADKAGATSLARRAVSLAPEDPIVNDTLGWVLFQTEGATPEALALMRKAYAGQPGNPEIRAHIQQIGNAMKRRAP